MAGAYSVRPTPNAQVSAPLTWDEVPQAVPADFTLATMISRYQAVGDLLSTMNKHMYSLEKLLELSSAQERAGQGEAPFPPQYRKAPGEPPRAAPSRRRKGATGRDSTARGGS